MARAVQLLGYLVLILAVVGELQFVGTALFNAAACGYTDLCWARTFTVGSGVPGPLYYSYAIWNALTYALLAAVGLALILTDSKRGTVASPLTQPA